MTNLHPYTLGFYVVGLGSGSYLPLFLIKHFTRSSFHISILLEETAIVLAS